MTTAAEAYDALRQRLTAGLTALPLKWPNENNQLPDEPAAFVYSVFTTAPQDLIAFGGGQGRNEFRTWATFECFVFVPVGSGLSAALQHAETIAALFRGQRFSNLSCYGATVDPEAIVRGPADWSGNYAACAAVIDLHFDQVG